MNAAGMLPIAAKIAMNGIASGAVEDVGGLSVSQAITPSAPTIGKKHPTAMG